MPPKKSGDLIRPALHVSSPHRRSSSMSSASMYTKAVHFDTHFERVRHYFQGDCPAAISVGSNPAENLDHDSGYTFPLSKDGFLRCRSLSEWAINEYNFSLEDAVYNPIPIKVKSISLSKDRSSLRGSVAVANLTFNKHVTCRFTLDH